MKSKAKLYFDKLNKILNKTDCFKLDLVIECLFKAWKNEKQIFVLGNGGSASTASHMACDIGKGTISKHYDTSRKRFRIISLTDNIATIGAYSNDINYNEIFKQQLNNLISFGDVVICISASGNSENVIRAAEYANQKRATTIGFLGFDGGKLKSIVDIPVIYYEKHYGRAEDAHLIWNHYITEVLSNLIYEYEKGNHLNLKLNS